MEVPFGAVSLVPLLRGLARKTAKAPRAPFSGGGERKRAGVAAMTYCSEDRTALSTSNPRSASPTTPLRRGNERELFPERTALSNKNPLSVGFAAFFSQRESQGPAGGDNSLLLKSYFPLRRSFLGNT